MEGRHSMAELGLPGKETLWIYSETARRPFALEVGLVPTDWTPNVPSLVGALVGGGLSLVGSLIAMRYSSGSASRLAA